MARVKSTSGPRRRGRFSPTALAVLASWRVRRTWGMLFMILVGMIAAVMLVCTVPLYIHVTTTAGLRSTITSDRESPYVQVQAGVLGLTKKSIQAASDQLNNFPQSNLSSFLDGPPEVVLKRSDLQVTSPVVAGANVFFSFAAYSIPQARPHIHLITGKVPSNNPNALQVLITPGTAKYLHIQVGSKIVVPLQFNYYDFATDQDTPYTVVLTLTVSGLYVADVAHDAFWHGDNPDPVLTQHSNAPTDIRARGLISSDALTSYFDAFYKQHNLSNGGAHPSIIDAYWYYRLNTSHLDINQIDDLINGLRSWKIYIFNNFGQDYNFQQGMALTTANISGAVIGTLQNDSIIDAYKSRLEVVNVPSGILMLELAALAIFFVSIMTGLLIERQSDTISVLRSRGASSWQIFHILTIQGLILTASALILGPLLGLVAANQLVTNIMPQQQDALNVINTHPQTTLTGIWPYAVVAAAVGLLAMIGAIVRAMRTDVLTLRRERARNTRRPLWQRLYLDLFAALIAVAGYGISLYISSVEGGDTRMQLLVSSPLSLIAPIFLIIAGVLLLLRLFPLILTLGAQLAARGRGAPALLAVGQMSRAPQQALRLTLLLALACSFAIFALVFNASQYQRILDVTDYQVGADFSGYTPYGGGSDPAAQEMAMMQMGGLVSVSAGSTGDLFITNTSHTASTRVEYRAVDANTFAKTAIWSSQDSTVPLDNLMQQLIDQRATAIKQHVVPAFVDVTTWNALKLTPGAHFLMQSTTSAAQSNKTAITYVALGQIEGLPTTDHSNAFNNLNMPTSAPGFMLTDFLTYQSVYQQQVNEPFLLDYIWLRAGTDATSIAHVRSILTSNNGAVYVLPMYDRYAMRDKMLQDPLYLTLEGELLLGMGTALLLALLGSLLASWLSVRTRLTNFAVLRALGTSLQQLTGMLTWEQGITYGMALFLGVIFGVLLITTVLPSLIFSSVPITTSVGSTAKNISEFYGIQSTQPIETVVPLSLIILLAVLIALCVLTLMMMTRAASGPTLSKSLRLNED